MKFIKLTEYSADQDYSNKEVKVTEKFDPIYVAIAKITAIKTGQVYYGGDKNEYRDKTIVAFDGNENYYFINETIDEILNAIDWACKS